MKVGIYNRYLATMGGGEKVSLAIAEYLSLRHPVTVISHSHVAKAEIEKRLYLDLSSVDLLTIPQRAPRDMTPVTSDYDLFINVTDMMYFPSFAPVSVNLVYFPAAILPRTSRSLPWRLKLVARSLFGLPAFTDGLRRIAWSGGCLSWVMDSPATIRLPVGRKSYSLRFRICSEIPAACRADLYLDDEKIDSTALFDGGKRALFQAHIPGGRRGWRDLTVRLCEIPTGEGKSEMLRFERLALDRAPHRLYRGLIEPYFKNWARRLYLDLPKTWILDYLKTYDAIWSISEYTRSWIEYYWGRESHVLYPPVDVKSFRAGTKENRILSVGRFFSGHHNKKHLEMIGAFKKMVDHGLSEWELHLAGGSTPGARHQEYVKRVQALSEGYPIVIHIDIPFERLVDLYGRSSIYWHATGCGEDDDMDPVKFEHFGIATIEAMAAGCVPVVIGKGGQSEIVQPGHNGFLWRSTDELTALTTLLIREPELTRKMSEAAIRDSRRFDKAHFQERLRELLQMIAV